MTIVKALEDYIIGLEHVGHIVDDLHAAVSAFCDVYGIDGSTVRYIPEEVDDDAFARFAFITISDTQFELIQPLASSFRDKLVVTPSGGGGINHVAWRVSDIDACVDALAAKGIQPGHVTPDGVVDTGQSRIVYLDPDDTQGLFIELVEPAR